MKKYRVTVNGTAYEIELEELTGAAPTVSSAPVAPAAAPAPVAAAPAGGEKISSPMPGTILDVKVSVGQSVKKGDVICVLEAMKMENDIPAPCDGVIASVNVQKGASVAANDVIATLN